MLNNVEMCPPHPLLYSSRKCMSIFTKLKDLTKALYGNIWQCIRTEAAALKAAGRAAARKCFSSPGTAVIAAYYLTDRHLDNK